MNNKKMESLGDGTATTTLSTTMSTGTSYYGSIHDDIDEEKQSLMEQNTTTTSSSSTTTTVAAPRFGTARTSSSELEGQWKALKDTNVKATTTSSTTTTATTATAPRGRTLSDLQETASTTSHSIMEGTGANDNPQHHISLLGGRIRLPFTWRRLALVLSLYVNLVITLTKLVAYLQTFSLSVLAALLDSVLDVVSQLVLNYTERHSSMQRSSALYPAGASRLEPIRVLTCAALMGMASFEVLKESFTTLLYHNTNINNMGGGLNMVEEGEEQEQAMSSSLAAFWSSIIIVKLLLLLVCNQATSQRLIQGTTGATTVYQQQHDPCSTSTVAGRSVVPMSDPTLDALALDHWNDALSNGVAAIALLCVLRMPALWFLDPVGAILISFYIIRSWYTTGQEQIEHLTGKAAPQDFLDELLEIATYFDERMEVDCLRAYHFGPKYVWKERLERQRERENAILTFSSSSFLTNVFRLLIHFALSFRLVPFYYITTTTTTNNNNNNKRTKNNKTTKNTPPTTINRTTVVQIFGGIGNGHAQGNVII